MFAYPTAYRSTSVSTMSYACERISGTAGRSKQDVEYCSICLDESVLAQSLADTTSAIEQSGGKTSSAQHTAVAMLLEKDESDDETPVGKERKAQSGVDVEKSKPGPEDPAN